MATGRRRKSLHFQTHRGWARSESLAKTTLPGFVLSRVVVHVAAQALIWPKLVPIFRERENMLVHLPLVQHVTESVRAGPQRDGAVLQACGDMASVKMNLAAIPAWARETYTAPAGSVNWLAVHSADLVESAFNPAMRSDARYKPFLPSDCIFSPVGVQLIRRAHSTKPQTFLPILSL